MKKILFTLWGVMFIYLVSAQKTYEIDASDVMMEPVRGHLKMGNPGPDDKKIEINNLYMTIGGKPVLPIMGEMQFSRIKRSAWEDCILKMKAGGVNIISTYLFWNHHEEIEGQFDWTDNRDIRAFVELCAKHHLFVCLRIGPWVHGEARNGGTPDWILRKKYLVDRSNDVVYQHYVRRYFSQMIHQFEGLYYKDGGNIVAIQLENEYWYAKKGEPHMAWLKSLAKELGADVPMYTVTGWGGGSVPPLEMIPLWGGYPDAPWVEHVGVEYQPENFRFNPFRDNKHIGNDQIEHKDKYMSYDLYPFFTCEMGIGVQTTYHRRLKISNIDGLGMIVARLGSGSNLLGYYPFAGATQPRGLLTSMEEEQELTGYWSRVTAKSYDFQAGIRESGEVSEAYRKLKKLHYFVTERAEELAPMMSVVSPSKEDEMQVAVRSDNKKGYLFGINYCRFAPKKNRPNARFSVKFQGEEIHLPLKSKLNIPDSTVFVWPLNLSVGNVMMKYATAQPICTIGNTSFFFQNGEIAAEFAFDTQTVERVEASKGKVDTYKGMTIVSELAPGEDCIIHLTDRTGGKKRIIVLTEKQADDCWLLGDVNPSLYLSSAALYHDGQCVWGTSLQPELKARRFDPAKGAFEDLSASTSVKQHGIKLTPVSLLADAQWLETANFKNIEPYMQRYHRFFFKEFSLDNPSRFRRVMLYLYPESDCKLNLNDTWVRQEVTPGVLNTIDLTGYVRKGENMLFIDFPFVEGQKKMAARVIVEYYNNDRVEFSTDTSWLATDMYTNPSLTRGYNRPEAPVVVAAPENAARISCHNFNEWILDIPFEALKDVNNVYLRTRYAGDRAELYSNYKLEADDFNNNTTWTVGLNRLETPVEGSRMRLVLYPLSSETKVYFDVVPGEAGYNRTEVKSFEVVPEYKLILK